MSTPATVLAGPTNGLTDVPGVRVGHARLHGEGALTGVTVVLAPPGGAVGGIDVRGAAPGTRETDLLDPRNTVERVHAVMLAGGSAHGLAAADGVIERLAAAGVGFPVGPSQGAVVPIVPAAVLFDLGRGGLFTARPSAKHGAAAYDAASGGPVAQGCVGAGTGAVAGGLRGGVGTASVLLAAGGGMVAALVVINAAGSTVDPRTGELYGARFGMDGEFDSLHPPAGASSPPPVPPTAGRATTLAVLATDIALTKAQCARLGSVGHDGMARAIRPLHTPFDGDAAFALSTTRLYQRFSASSTPSRLTVRRRCRPFPAPGHAGEATIRVGRVDLRAAVGVAEEFPDLAEPLQVAVGPMSTDRWVRATRFRWVPLNRTCLAQFTRLRVTRAYLPSSACPL